LSGSALSLAGLAAGPRRRPWRAVSRWPTTPALRLTGLKWTDADVYPPARKKAVLESSSIAGTLKGAWELVDNKTGGVISTTGTKTILSLPAVTGRGAFIRNGNERAIGTPFRAVFRTGGHGNTHSPQRLSGWPDNLGALRLVE
jgi:hypothetical protein